MKKHECFLTVTNEENDYFIKAIEHYKEKICTSVEYSKDIGYCLPRYVRYVVKVNNPVDFYYIGYWQMIFKNLETK